MHEVQESVQQQLLLTTHELVHVLDDDDCWRPLTIAGTQSHFYTLKIGIEFPLCGSLCVESVECGVWSVECGVLRKGGRRRGREAWRQKLGTWEMVWDRIQTRIQMRIRIRNAIMDHTLQTRHTQWVLTLTH